MATNRRLRGSDWSVGIAVDGMVLGGSLREVQDFDFSPKDTIDQVQLLGDSTETPDYQHNGYSGKITFYHSDPVLLQLHGTQVRRYKEHQAPPVITITAVKRYTGGSRSGTFSNELVLKLDDDKSGGRKGFNMNSVSFECKDLTGDLVQE